MINQLEPPRGNLYLIRGGTKIRKISRVLQMTLIILFSVYVNFLNLPQAQALGGAKEREECLKMPEDYDKYRCLEGIVLSKNEPHVQKEKSFSALIDCWNHKDGEGGSWISDIFLDILSNDYHFFFSQMKKYPREYGEWLSLLGELSFVGIDREPLDTKRERLINLLEGISDLPKGIDPLRVRLLRVLKEIKPRQID